MSRAPKASEAAIQIAIRKALTWHGVRSRHIPNGGKRDKMTAISLKRQGVVAGVPDLLVWVPGQPARVGFLEVKTPRGRLSDAQASEIDGLEADGVPVAVVRSVDDALAAVKAWGWV